MGEIMLLDELAIIAALSVAVTVLLARLQLPTVAGLLAAGALVGPYGLRLVSSVASIEMLAEVGVVLLLFSIGLEFSLERLKHIFRQVALGGALQVGLTVLAAVGIASLCGLPASQGLYFGFVFALSSTAIVLRALAERRELDAPHGRFIVGTLIFQDLCVVPMVLIVPLLGPAGGDGALALFGLALAKAAGVVAAIFLAARFVVPRVLAWVDASRSREVFLLAVLALCIGTAWLTSLAGLSLALGAFLGGMVVADTEYGHRAMGDIVPLRDAFVSIFFVSLGMLFDIHVVLARPGLVLLLLVGFLVGKAIVAVLAAQAMRFPARAAWLAGVGLAQFGEFGFVLARLGESHGIVDGATLQPVMAAGIASMFLTPVLMRLAPHITAGERLLAPLERLIGVGSINDAAPSVAVRQDHVVLVGYGVAGELAARALRESGIDFVVLELNSDNVRRGRAEGVPIFYGDATSEETLGHAQLASARALVLLINDHQAAQRVVDTARRVAPGVSVLMRTRYLSDKDMLLGIGATDVVAEEVEGGAEVVARLLRWCQVPRNVIEQRLAEMRASSQEAERPQLVRRRTLGEHEQLADLKIESVLLGPEDRAVGRSAVELTLGQRTRALVVAIRRGGALLDQPTPAAPFAAGDVVYLVGRRTAIDAAIDLMTGRDDGPDTDGAALS